MEPSRDDFVIAIRSAFLKKGTKQRFSLIVLLLISKETGLPVIIAEDPLSCVAIGTGKALDQEETFSAMLVS